MRLSFYVCILNLVILGICGGVTAFSGFDLLNFLLFSNAVAVKSFLSVCLVSALFVVYYLLFFFRIKRQKGVRYGEK